MSELPEGWVATTLGDLGRWSGGGTPSKRKSDYYDVRPMEIPVPSRAEQDEIVRRIEAAFARIDRMTEEGSRAARFLDRLDERRLAKAFRGELVP